MRSELVTTQRGFQAKAIGGTHVILIALNCPNRRSWEHGAEIPSLAESIQVNNAGPQERPGPK